LLKRLFSSSHSGPIESEIKRFKSNLINNVSPTEIRFNPKGNHSVQELLNEIDASWATENSIIDRTREMRHLRQFASLRQVILSNFAHIQTWDERMRNSIVDWTAQAAAYLGLFRETLWHAIRLIDEVCSQQAVSPPYLPLVATASLWIASKIHEVHIPKIEQLVDLLDGAFQQQQILWAESHILMLSRFQILRSIPFIHIVHLANVEKDETKREAYVMLAVFLSIAAIPSTRFINVSPHILGAAAYLAAIVAMTNVQQSDYFISHHEPSEAVWLRLAKRCWTSSHVRYSGNLTVEELAPITMEVYRSASSSVKDLPGLVRVAEAATANTTLGAKPSYPVASWFDRWAALNQFWLG
jgi:hypothetical protein